MFKSFQLPQINFDSHDTVTGDFGDLPNWDLNDLYPSPDGEEITKDLKALESNCSSFASEYQGQLDGLTAEGLLNCIERYEDIQNVAGRVMSFAGLSYYQNTSDANRSKFMADMQSKITDFTTPLVFFSLEINNIDDEHIQNLLNSNHKLSRYKPIIDNLRKMKPHQLSDELEQFLHDQSVVGTAAWNRLFDETMASLKFNVDDELLSLEATLNLLSDKNRETREKGTRALIKVFGENISLFSRITNTLAKEKEVEDRWRKMPTPQFSRHLANQVEPEVVEALRNAVVTAYPKLSHRYYALKAKWMNLDSLEVWDRNAPLDSDNSSDIQWEDAKKIVLDAYSDFSPKMANIAEPFFSKGWIDAGVKPGKAPGAFAHPTVTNVHPYVMLNYMGKQRDVMTLAHELGHGVHQVLAASQGELLSSTPLTLAETASVFGEMLTFRKMLDKATDPVKRKHLLANKVEDMINTVVRQIAFYDFECKLHAARANGELTPDQINEIWMSIQAESLGPIFNFVEGYETFWTYIPHFIHSPFYVYAYAFGDGLVNALYAVYEEGNIDFQDKYFDMLSAGGSMHHKELLEPFGLDASDPKFWDKGLSLISSMIDELEAMES